MGKTLTTIAVGAALVGLAFATGGASIIPAVTSISGFGVAPAILSTTALGSTLLVAGGGAILASASSALKGKGSGGVSQAQVSRTSPNIDPATYRKTVYGKTAMPIALRAAPAA